MKVLAFSDMHLSRRCADDITQASADADLVIAAGDFCTMRNGLAEAMALLSGINAPLVMVPGNAESIDELRAAAPDTAHVLHGEGARIGGLTLFGLGYGIPVTPFGDWSCDMDDAAAEALLAGCSQADVLVTHSPPKGWATSHRMANPSARSPFVPRSNGSSQGWRCSAMFTTVGAPMALSARPAASTLAPG